MGDTIPGSHLMVASPFTTQGQTLQIDMDRVRIREIRWNYPADTLNIFLDYGRDDPLSPGTDQWFQQSQAHPIDDLVANINRSLNGVTFNLVAGTEYTTLKATAGTVNGLQEDAEDAIFTALVQMGYFPGGVEG